MIVHTGTVNNLVNVRSIFIPLLCSGSCTLACYMGECVHVILPLTPQSTVSVGECVHVILLLTPQSTVSVGECVHVILPLTPQSIVGMGEFVNFLTGKGCDLAEATTCFQELDTEGEGGTDITYCLAVSFMCTSKQCAFCNLSTRVGSVT